MGLKISVSTYASIDSSLACEQSAKISALRACCNVSKSAGRMVDRVIQTLKELRNEGVRSISTDEKVWLGQRMRYAGLVNLERDSFNSA